MVIEGRTGEELTEERWQRFDVPGDPKQVWSCRGVPAASHGTGDDERLANSRSSFPKDSAYILDCIHLTGEQMES